jgi:hypothetical protein
MEEIHTRKASKSVHMQVLKKTCKVCGSQLVCNETTEACPICNQKKDFEPHEHCLHHTKKIGIVCCKCLTTIEPEENENKYNGMVNSLELIVESQSCPGHGYIIQYSRKNGIRCACPGYNFKKNCDHKKDLQKVVDYLNKVFFKEQFPKAEDPPGSEAKLPLKAKEE